MSDEKRPVRFSDYELTRLREDFNEFKVATNAKLDALLKRETERDGAIKLVRVMAVVIATGASAWAWIMAQINGLVPK